MIIIEIVKFYLNFTLIVEFAVKNDVRIIVRLLRHGLHL